MLRLHHSVEMERAMAVNEESRQVEIAETLSEVARSLVRSTRVVPRPFDSYSLLGSLAVAQEVLAQIYAQLAEWHGQVLQGVHHSGEDERGSLDNPGWARAELELQDAAHHAAAAEASLRRAHSANGVVKWFDEARQVIDEG